MVKALSATLLVYRLLPLFGASTLASNTYLWRVLLQMTEILRGGDDNQMPSHCCACRYGDTALCSTSNSKGCDVGSWYLSGKLQGMADKSKAEQQNKPVQDFKRHAESIEGRMAASNNRLACTFAGGYRNRRNFRHKSTEEQTARNQEEGLLQHITAHPE